jgi:protein import protein ZIM17
MDPFLSHTGLAVFTCTVCNTRSAKQFTENAYRNGVVVVTCPGCQNRHLIADNLSFFSDDDGGWNIEKAMAKLGQNVDMVTKDNVMELSLDQVIGEDYVKAVVGSEADEEGDGKPTSS